MLGKRVNQASRKRSVVKALTWRMIATTTTTVIVYWLTGSFELGLGAGVLDLGIKLIFYYLHERAWGRVKFGYGKD